MSQLARLISLLTILQSKRLITATELSEKYGVSIRTVYRDIRKLEEAGVPIITLEGKGYSIMEGYFLSPIRFDQNEVNAMITAEKIVAKSKNQSLIKHFNDALTKIKSTFKSQMQIKSELLESKMFVLSTSKNNIENKALSKMQMAITDFYMVKLKYQKANSDKVSEREIEPLAIYSYNDIWIVIAWCHLRNDYRSFRLDRIQEFRLLSKHFEDRAFDIRSYFAACPEENMRQEW